MTFSQAVGCLYGAVNMSQVGTIPVMLSRPQLLTHKQTQSSSQSSNGISLNLMQSHCIKTKSLSQVSPGTCPLLQAIILGYAAAISENTDICRKYLNYLLGG